MSGNADKGCKVLLFTPPRGLFKGAVERPWNTTQPLGLAYVAAAVRAAGHEVQVVDGYSLGTPAARIRERIESFNPRVVGISALTPQWHDAEALAALAKSVDENILTVVGGPHVTALPAQAAASPDVDVAVIGEGELPAAEVCDAVVTGGDLGRIPGLVLGQGGEVMATAPRPALEDLDSLPFPAHDLLPEPSFYNPFLNWGKKGNFSSIVSGRGCPYGCSFCDVTTQQGKRYRLRSARNVVDELSWLNSAFGVTSFSFRDPSMICGRNRLREMCSLIQERSLDIAWTCNSRASEVDPEMLAWAKKAGCWQMQFGIEVGNPELLKKIKKTTREKITTAVGNTRRAGISPHGYFLFGFMEETPETVEQTIDFARQLDLDSAGFGMMVPFPGTDEWEKFRAGGLLLTEDWWRYDIMGEPVYRHQNLSSEELFQATRRAYRRFYLRPRIIARHLRKLNSWWALREYVHAARRVFH